MSEVARGSWMDGVLHLGSITTPYRRMGAGAPVLVVVEGGFESGAAEWLRRTLPAGHRLFIPMPPRDGVETGWLRGVVDALGLLCPTILVDEALAPRVMDFRSADPGRAGGVAILAEPGGSIAVFPAGARGAALTALLDRVGGRS